MRLIRKVNFSVSRRLCGWSLGCMCQVASAGVPERSDVVVPARLRMLPASALLT